MMLAAEDGAQRCSGPSAPPQRHGARALSAGIAMNRNRHHRETSPYLLQHQANPVHWQAWDAAALDLARRTDRPILLSVGYAACHWCHVMAHESFEKPETAALMNEL